MSTTPVFFVDALPVGADAVLDGPEGRHAATVRRLQAGQRLDLCDGAGGVAQCTVRSVARHVLRLDVLARKQIPAVAPRLVVAQALAKGDRGELAVELLTEAGADVVVPWAAERCVVRWSDERRARSLARWRSTAREAAKQSRRACLPEVREPVTTADLAELAAAAETAYVLHESAIEPLAGRPAPSTGDVLVVVGPEGGISPAELALLGAAGAVPVRLGSTVLRTSSAGMAALSVLSVATGRWA